MKFTTIFLVFLAPLFIFAEKLLELTPLEEGVFRMLLIKTPQEMEDNITIYYTEEGMQLLNEHIKYVGEKDMEIPQDMKNGGKLNL